MTDVTNLFKATVKTLKSRKKILTGKNDAVTTEILPVSKQRCDFEMKAKELVNIYVCMHANRVFFLVKVHSVVQKKPVINT